MGYQSKLRYSPLFLVAFRFATSVSERKEPGQHAVIKLQVLLSRDGMTNGPIRAKQVNRCYSVIGHIDELASTIC